ncbi:MAG: cobyric acid synthase, partial [Desulfovibrionaceae bacterium]|nr:cobyric acid synthase [Desulfovibrionaceae bacterium]
NRFRGRKSLLDDALRFTHERTGKPVFGVVDYISSLGLPEEDSVTFKAGLFETHSSPNAEIEIGLIDLPHISNFTDFEPFLAEPDVTIRIISSVDDLHSVSVILLPGSKNVMVDLSWLEQTGLAKEIIQIYHDKKIPVIGICGGFQMLGRIIHDPHQIESSGKSIEGLGLLDMETVLEQDKTLVRQEGTHLPSSLDVHGYEIHHGQSQGRLFPLLDFQDITAGAITRDNLIWGSYLHGIFDADPFRRWFIDSLRKQKGLEPANRILAHYDLEPAFDSLAAAVREQLDMDSIYRLLKL